MRPLIQDRGRGQGSSRARIPHSKERKLPSRKSLEGRDEDGGVSGLVTVPRSGL